MRLDKLLADARNLREELDALNKDGHSTDKKVFVHAYVVGSFYRTYPTRGLVKGKTRPKSHKARLRIVGGKAS